VALIDFTVYYAKRAAEEARRAADAGWKTVDEAKNATKTAENTLLVIKENAHRELRAYVLIKETAVKRCQAGHAFRADIRFRNSGQTPAYDVTAEWTAAFYTGPAPIEFILRPIEDVDRSQAPLGPESDFSFTATTSQVIDESLLGQIKDGITTVYVFGIVTYFDAFKEKRTTEFRLFFGKNNFRSDKFVLSACPDGNKAT
jgi:hypothetical protein